MNIILLLRILPSYNDLLAIWISILIRLLYNTKHIFLSNFNKLNKLQLTVKKTERSSQLPRRKSLFLLPHLP